ncbi:hypothetical protein [Pseudomonas aeruginosa]|uniref:hypothetical protein n=1 Tax=Pseudomonas aeruginosa TaxID=287 RepID=UPI000EAD94C3|nr:hypothetical protein [Pseudomonas aeruginosa]
MATFEFLRIIDHRQYGVHIEAASAEHAMSKALPGDEYNGELVCSVEISDEECASLMKRVAEAHREVCCG